MIIQGSISYWDQHSERSLPSSNFAEEIFKAFGPIKGKIQNEEEERK